METARDVALTVLRRVETHGAFAASALRAEFARGALPGRDRGLTTELVYGVLRRRIQLDRALSGFGRRLKDIDPKLHDVLRLGAYQILFMRVPAHAAVNEAVDAARARRGTRGAGFVNALLRRLAEKTELPVPPDAASDPVGHLSIAGSLPRPLAEHMIDELGFEAALTFATACLERPELILRANLLRTTRDALAAEVEGTPGEHPRAVVLPAKLGGLPADLAAVIEGRATLQDEGSMRVVDLVDPQPGERVLDLCAAPGGKTTYLAERMNDQGEVVASDRSSDKLRRVETNRDRLGLRCIVTSDPAPAAEPVFDRVLVDAPCSGLGTLRRHPEIRFRFRPDDLTRLIALQRSLLRKAGQRVRPGGVLVYSVCSMLPSEGRAQLETLRDFELVEAIETHPGQPGAPDGFYAAKLIKR